MYVLYKAYDSIGQDFIDVVPSKIVVTLKPFECIDLDMLCNSYHDTDILVCPICIIIIIITPRKRIFFYSCAIKEKRTTD